MSRRAVALAAGAAIIGATAASGGVASPLLPLFALWAALARGSVRRPVPLAIAALVVLAAIDALAGGVLLDGIAAATLVALLCVVMGRLGPATGGREKEGSADPDVSAGLGSGSPGRAVADVREWIGARGVALWRVEAESGHARLVAAAGRRPPSVIAIDGSPLAWVAASGTPMPVEPAPDWVEPTASLTAASVPTLLAAPAAYLFTLELPRETAVPQALLTCAAAVVGAALDRDREATRHAHELGRSECLIDALRKLPRVADPAEYAEQLLATARALAGASGAALALWREDDGEIVHCSGYDGGPAVGQALDSPASEMALAARSHSTILRDAVPAAAPAAPLAHHAEAWRRRPRARATVPLWSGAAVVGVIAVWNTTAEPLDGAGIRMLEAIARVCGAQLAAVTSVGSLQHTAERDALTGLLNRRGFERVYASEAARAERYGRPIAAIAIDIDHFKSVNDRFGHETGDTVLRKVAGAIETTIRETDRAARTGGEEFVVLLPETGLHAAREAAERIRAAVAALRASEPGLPCDVRASLGVSSLPECVVLANRLLRSADEALYDAKRGGRNRVAVAQPWVEKTPEFR